MLLFKRMSHKVTKVLVLFSLLILVSHAVVADNSILGASLYFSPLSENPRVGSNFTLTIKTDSLAQPVGAIKGQIIFNPEKLEIINISKIGSMINVWLEEPNYSNLEGKLSFQGGVPNPGFIGNGGTVLHFIFKAKTSGISSIGWVKAEVLTRDGKGASILTNLQNYDFLIEKPLSFPQKDGASFWGNPIVILNIILLVALILIGVRFFIKSILKSHDQDLHEQEPRESHESRELHEPHEHDKSDIYRDNVFK